MTLSLGIDIGTSGVRTAVLDARGQVLSTARQAHLPQDPKRIDANLWWQAVARCVKAQVSALRDLGHSGQDIAGVTVDGTSGSMVLTDGNLNPVSRALMYNSKGFEDEAAQIAQFAPERHITQGAGSALGRGMRLVAECQETPRHLSHQADFVTARLTGIGGLSDHNNALKTGFDPEVECWPDWMGHVIAPSLLPKALAVGTAISPLDAHVARTLGVNRDAIVYAGTTDSIAAYLACAPLEPGVAVTSLGSTLAIKVLNTRRIDSPEIGLYSHRLGDLWLAGGASNTGGAVLAAHFSAAEIADLSQQIDPTAPSSLDFYPLNAPGERFPFNDPNLPPRLAPRPDSDAAFLHGMLEGIARIEARCYAEVQSKGGVPTRRILSAGGGASNPVFTTIRARHLGLVPETPEQTEACVGAARIAQRGTKLPL